MEDLEWELELAEQEETRISSLAELRSIEMRAYAEFISAIRASGGMDEEKMEIIEIIRKYFDISEDRHLAEVRRVACDETLSAIANGINGYVTSQDWIEIGYKNKISPPQIHPLNSFKLFTTLEELVESKREELARIVTSDDPEIISQDIFRIQNKNSKPINTPQSKTLEENERVVAEFKNDKEKEIEINFACDETMPEIDEDEDSNGWKSEGEEMRENDKGDQKRENSRSPDITDSAYLKLSPVKKSPNGSCLDELKALLDFKSSKDLERAQSKLRKRTFSASSSSSSDSIYSVKKVVSEIEGMLKQKTPSDRKLIIEKSQNREKYLYSYTNSTAEIPALNKIESYENQSKLKKSRNIKVSFRQKKSREVLETNIYVQNHNSNLTPQLKKRQKTKRSVNIQDNYKIKSPERLIQNPPDKATNFSEHNLTNLNNQFHINSNYLLNSSPQLPQQKYNNLLPYSTNKTHITVTCQNMSNSVSPSPTSFYKKRTQNLTPTTYTPQPSEPWVAHSLSELTPVTYTNVAATASSLAVRNRTYSVSQELKTTPGLSGQVKVQRKAQPHILTGSKVNRSSSSNTTSPAQNLTPPISTSGQSLVGNLQTVPNFITTTSGIQSVSTSIAINRAKTPTNIILVQKPLLGASPVGQVMRHTFPTQPQVMNQMNIKGPAGKAVILRRATNNLMILDSNTRFSQPSKTSKEANLGNNIDIVPEASNRRPKITNAQPMQFSTGVVNLPPIPQLKSITGVRLSKPFTAPLVYSPRRSNLESNKIILDLDKNESPLLEKYILQGTNISSSNNLVTSEALAGLNCSTSSTDTASEGEINGSYSLLPESNSEIIYEMKDSMLTEEEKMFSSLNSSFPTPIGSILSKALTCGSKQSSMIKNNESSKSQDESIKNIDVDISLEKSEESSLDEEDDKEIELIDLVDDEEEDSSRLKINVIYENKKENPMHPISPPPNTTNITLDKLIEKIAEPQNDTQKNNCDYDPKSDASKSEEGLEQLNINISNNVTELSHASHQNSQNTEALVDDEEKEMSTFLNLF